MKIAVVGLPPRVRMGPEALFVTMKSQSCLKVWRVCLQSGSEQKGLAALAGKMESDKAKRIPISKRCFKRINMHGPPHGIENEWPAIRALSSRPHVPVLHSDERLAFVLVNVVDDADVRGIEGESCLGFPLQSFQ